MSAHRAARPTRGRPTRVRPIHAQPGGFRLRDPGELVAALPPLLGFHPSASLVLASLGRGSQAGRSGGRIGLVVRSDLPEPVPEHERGVARHAVEAVLRDQPEGAALIVVDAREPAAAPASRRLLGHAADLLEERGVEVRAVIWAAGTAGGSRWRCLGPCGCCGVVPEQESSALAAGAAVAGTVVYPERSALVELVTPVDRAAIQRRERLLTELVDASGDPAADDAADVVELTDPVAATARVAEAVAAATAGRLRLGDRAVVALAVALTVPLVRDTAIAAMAAPGGPEASGSGSGEAGPGSSGAGSSGAEQLWSALTRETPDPEAAEPAALLAIAALLRGDGALANVAIDRAQQAWPGHRLSGMLRTVADLGIRPAEFRSALLAEGEPSDGGVRP